MVWTRVRHPCSCSSLNGPTASLKKKKVSESLVGARKGISEDGRGVREDEEEYIQSDKIHYTRIKVSQ